MTKFYVQQQIKIEREKLVRRVDSDTFEPQDSSPSREKGPVQAVVVSVPNPSNPKTKGTYHLSYNNCTYAVDYRIKMEAWVTAPGVAAPVVTAPKVTVLVATPKVAPKATPVVTPVVAAPKVTALVMTPVMAAPKATLVITPVRAAPKLTDLMVTPKVAPKATLVMTPVVTAPKVTAPVVTAPVVTTIAGRMEASPIRLRCNAVGVPPVCSTGDCIQLAAFLVLYRTDVFKGEVPTIYLAYDSTAGTKAAAEASHTFLRALGLSSILLKVECCTRPNDRRHKTMETMKTKSNGGNCVDHKMLTSFLNQAATEFGKNVIGKFVFDYFEKVTEQRDARGMRQAAFEWAQTEAKRCFNALELVAHPFVLVAIRFSDKANENQNFTSELLQQIDKYLSECLGIKMVLLDIGGRVGAVYARYNTKTAQINCFPEQEHLQGKLPYLCLLQTFSKYATFKGVIGTTSGMLDLAAYMGLHTFCIHRFKPNTNTVNDQDLRVLLQHKFMTVVGDFDEEAQKLLKEWIKGKSLPPLVSVLLEGPQPNMELKSRQYFCNAANNNETNPFFRSQFNEIYRMLDPERLQSVAA
ncbi:hypothetical protein BASA81_003047 [Batrachochytrium salamandrivorans]|nr:hypothetical protein BASA81_003047 [Batrachochytrium salamandrivorans]